jgi:FkbM family methyltransferase
MDQLEFLSESNYRISFERVNMDNSQFLIPAYAKHRPVSLKMCSKEIHEPKTHLFVKQYMQSHPGSMVHAGTFFGDMLPSFSNSCSNLIYAFEPVLENFVLANLCIELNDLKNVFLLRAALGDYSGLSHISTQSQISNVHLGGGSTIGPSGQITPIYRLDDLPIKDISLIHLDIEGFELEALTGSRDTIRKYKPVILIEDNKKICAELLERENYCMVGDIPSLQIWSHFADVESTKFIYSQLREDSQ